MLIRWATETERMDLGLLPEEYGEFDALIAVDRMTGRLLGYAAFSRDEKKIRELRVLGDSKTDEIEERLKRCSSNQIEPKGASFHYRYPSYYRDSQKETCPCCTTQPMPEGHFDLAELGHSWVEVSPEAQGRLFGKCCVVAKHHSALFYDLPRDIMADYMSDVQRAAAALHRITQAVKINYEIHGNSGAHLHCHLFPRYLDDDFPGGAPIQYKVTEPSPYESKEEFDWFVAEMRKALAPEA